MAGAGTLTDVLATMQAAVVAASEAMPIAGGVGGVALAANAGVKLWEIVQAGEQHRGQGTAWGWALAFVVGSLMTLYSVFVGLASFAFTGWG